MLNKLEQFMLENLGKVNLSHEDLDKVDIFVGQSYADHSISTKVYVELINRIDNMR